MAFNQAGVMPALFSLNTLPTPGWGGLWLIKRELESVLQQRRIFSAFCVKHFIFQNNMRVGIVTLLGNYPS